MPDNRYRSRKFILAMILTIGGVAGWMLGRELVAFAAFAGAILGAYGWTSNNDPDKKNPS